ncbi:MAG: hypothetical protein KJO07_03840, partial [Deltaproteobacteria bacterium]|nr:hypothetical protein [Deltaproteobacteria bacterium]
PNGKRVWCKKGRAPHGLEIMWLAGRVQVNSYDSGVYDGPYAVWMRDGQKIEEGLWKAGRHEGDFFQWYEDGTLKVRGQFLRDRRHGQWTYYDQSGSVDRAVQFENGRAVEETAGGK